MSKYFDTPSKIVASSKVSRCEDRLSEKIGSVYRNIGAGSNMPNGTRMLHRNPALSSNLCPQQNLEMFNGCEDLSAISEIKENDGGHDGDDESGSDNDSQVDGDNGLGSNDEEPVIPKSSSPFFRNTRKNRFNQNSSKIDIRSNDMTTGATVTRNTLVDRGLGLQENRIFSNSTFKTINDTATKTNHTESSSNNFGSGIRNTASERIFWQQENRPCLNYKFKTINNCATKTNQTDCSKTFDSIARPTPLDRGQQESRLFSNLRFNAVDNSVTKTNPTEGSSNIFGLGTRNTSLITGFGQQENSRPITNSRFKSINDSSNMINFSRTSRLPSGTSVFNSLRNNVESNRVITNNRDFLRPSLARSNILRKSCTTGLFSNQSIERQGGNAYNPNGFEVSHISRRGMDTLQDSRTPFSVLLNPSNNHSIAQSVVTASMASVKSQFVNLLEDLQYSILKSLPGASIDVLRPMFDKTKERLDNINELSFAPTVRENDGASYVSHPLKCVGSMLHKGIKNKTVEDIPLKNGKEILKALYEQKLKNNSVLPQEGEDKSTALSITTQQNIESEDEKEDSALLFKKPKPFLKFRRKSSSGIKINTPQKQKSLESKTTNQNFINLRQWYPLAVGYDLTFCGTDENGEIVQTEPVKKRINNRKVELINNLECNLIGNPSDSIGELFPKSMISKVKDGLIRHWKLFQKELVKVQSVKLDSKNTNSSKKPKISQEIGTQRNTPLSRRQKVQKPVRTRTLKAKLIETDLISSQNRKTKSSNITPGVKKSIKKQKETNENKVSPKNVKTVSVSPKTTKRSRKNSCSEKVDTEPKVQTKSGRILKPPREYWMGMGSDEVSSSKVSHKSLSVTTERMPSRNRAAREKKQISDKEISKKKLNENAKETEEEVRVHSSTDDSKLQSKNLRVTAKRKREVAGDVDTFQRKKLRSDKTDEPAQPVVGSTMNDRAAKTKKKASKRQRVSFSPEIEEASSKPKKKKEGRKKGKKEIKDQKKNASVLNECEDDELHLKDINIPEIGKTSGYSKVNKSQLRFLVVETPPLKYFNNNLRMVNGPTPVPSPDWCISQRTASEVKQFQNRRAQVSKKNNKINSKKDNRKKGRRSPTSQNVDLKKVLQWISDRNNKTPSKSSKILKYIIPSRKQTEESDEEEEEKYEDEMSFSA